MNVKDFLCLRLKKGAKTIITYSFLSRSTMIRYLDNRWDFHYRKVCEGETPTRKVMLPRSLHVLNVACVMEFDLNTLRTNDKRFWPHKSFFCN